ncbi:MAG: VOC family protein [Chitinophagales bacterium]
MQPTKNKINWFEIPTNDINKSKAFYEAIFDIKMEYYEQIDEKLAFFPWNGDYKVNTGTLIEREGHKPSKDGVMIFFDANPDIDIVLNRAIKLGAKIIHAKKDVGVNGYLAVISDLDDNSIGLHANKPKDL